MDRIAKIKRLFLLDNVRRCYRRQASPGSLLFPVIWVTYRCNLSCRMCNQWRTDWNHCGSELSTREWFDFIDAARELNAAVIVVTGGEPLLREDIFSIISRVRKNKISCHLCTNGTLLNASSVSRLKEAGLNSLSVSLDSYIPELHNALRRCDCFDAAVAGIKLVHSAAPRIKLGINYVVTKKNFLGLDRMLAFARQLGVDQIKFDRIHVNLMHRGLPLEECQELLFTPQDLPALKNEVDKLIRADKTGILTNSGTFLKGMSAIDGFAGRRLDCYAGYVSCAVDPFGHVSPCEGFPGQESLRDKPLKEIWNSAAFSLLRKQARCCQEPCWDTTHAELNIRCCPEYFIKELPQVIKEMKFYLA